MFRLIIEGKVQGVNYRDFVKREAEKLDLKGYVKNQSDGTVEVVVDSDDKTVDKFKKILKKGTLMSWVDKINVSKIDSSEVYDGFDVHYS